MPVRISRARRAELQHAAHELRHRGQREGWPVERIASAIRGELPDILPLEAWRLAYGWSRPQVISGISRLYQEDGLAAPPANPSMLCRWEHGTRLPSAEYAAMLSRLYQVDTAQLDLADCADSAAGYFRLRDPADDPRHTAAEEADDTNRREMLSGIAATGLALAGFRLPAPGGMPRRVGPQHVAELRRLTEMYRTMTYSRGADTEVQRGVGRLLNRATALLGQAPSPQLRTELLDATADAAGLAAYGCRDLGQHEWAQHYYLIAMQAAQAAGDDALAGHLVVRMAGHHIELARPRQVLDYLQAARQHGSPATFTHAELSNQHAIAAWANAQADNAQNMLSEVGSAEDHFADAEHRTGPDWQVRHTAEAELWSLTGAGYAELAKHQPRYAEEAISRLTRALDLRGADGARNATLDTISLAEAHLADHDPGQATRIAADAVLLAQDSASRRIRKRLRELGQQLAPHRGSPGTADVLDDIITLAT